MPKKAGIETLTAAGAEALARQIEQYWRREGFAVSCRRIYLASSIQGRLHETSMFAIKSDLVAGLPR
jgi:hypothetical protein